MASKWVVRTAIALILITAFVLILPFGEGAATGLIERVASLTATLAAAGIVIFVRLKARGRRNGRENDLFDERYRLMLEKTARITYAVFYLSALALANIFFILGRLGFGELQYPAITLYLCVAFIALVHRTTFAYLKRRYD